MTPAEAVRRKAVLDALFGFEDRRPGAAPKTTGKVYPRSTVPRECHTCHEVKPAEAFNANVYRPSGLRDQSSC
jgi:hypothetical protein